MRIGAVFPQTEIGTDPAAIRDYVQAVEGLGFDHLTAIDHVLGAGTPSGPPWAKFYTRDRMFHEPLLLFAHLAAVTERIELTTAILILSQRQTALVAKQAAELDVLDGGAHPPWHRHRLERGRVRGPERELPRSRPAGGGAGGGPSPPLERGPRHLRGPLASAERRLGSTRRPCRRPIPVWFGAFEAGRDPARRPARRRLAHEPAHPSGGRGPGCDRGVPRVRARGGPRPGGDRDRRDRCTRTARTRPAGRRTPAPGRIRGRATSPSGPSTAGFPVWMSISTRSAASGRALGA